MNELVGYKVSKDYDLLWELSGEQSVICVNRLGGVARTVCFHGTQERGIKFMRPTRFYAKTRNMFCRRCYELGVEWLVPTEGNSE